MAGRQRPIECAYLQWLYLDQDRFHSLVKDVNVSLLHGNSENSDAKTLVPVIRQKSLKLCSGF